MNEKTGNFEGKRENIGLFGGIWPRYISGDDV